MSLPISPFQGMPLIVAGSILVVAAGAPSIPLPADGPPPSSPYGKTVTSRSIELSAVVDGTPESVFKLWTTVDGANRFFGADATIEPRVGGAYEIYFLPRSHPDSDANSTRGARVLEIRGGEKLAFEWTAPPFAAELNTDPLPTWVEIEFERFSEDPDRTLLRLSHRGFREGGPWDRTYDFFQRNWFEVLYRLKRHCEVRAAGSGSAGSSSGS